MSCAEREPSSLSDRPWPALLLRRRHIPPKRGVVPFSRGQATAGCAIEYVHRTVLFSAGETKIRRDVPQQTSLMTGAYPCRFSGPTLTPTTSNCQPPLYARPQSQQTVTGGRKAEKNRVKVLQCKKTKSTIPPGLTVTTNARQASAPGVALPPQQPECFKTHNI